LTILPQQKLDALLARHSLVESELASGLGPDAYVKLSREFAELSPIVETIKSYRTTDREIAELSALVDDSSTDAEMRKLADLAAERRDGRSQRDP
jgi:peptide chain release factor 1